METQYKRPKLTAEEIRRLPNLLQVIKHFNKLTNDFATAVVGAVSMMNLFPTTIAGMLHQWISITT